MNDVSIQCKAEEKDSEMDSERESVHSNWNTIMPVEVNNSVDTVVNNTTQKERTVRNIVLVPYKPKPKDWGSWKIKSPYATSTVARPILDKSEHI